VTKAIRSHENTLHPQNGGFVFQSNCPVCGGGWIVEGASRGRDTIPKCTSVRQAVYCSGCRMQMLLEVRLSVVPR